MARAATDTASPGLTSSGSTWFISAVSSTTVHVPAYSADGRVNSIGSEEALNAR